MTSTAAGNCCQNSEMSPEKCLAVCETLSENQQRDPWSAHSTREWGKGLQRPHKHTIWAAHPQAVRWQKPRDLGQAASPRALALLTNPGRISLWASGTAPPLEGLWGHEQLRAPQSGMWPPAPMRTSRQMSFFRFSEVTHTSLSAAMRLGCSTTTKQHLCVPATGCSSVSLDPDESPGRGLFTEAPLPLPGVALRPPYAHLLCTF